MKIAWKVESHGHDSHDSVKQKLYLLNRPLGVLCFCRWEDLVLVFCFASTPTTSKYLIIDKL